MYRLPLVLLLLGAAPAAPGQTADDWIAGPVIYPAGWSQTGTNDFTQLGSEAIGQKLKVSWFSPATPTNAVVSLWTSLDRPGHWAARAWQSRPMIGRPGSWDYSLPVTHLDLPVVYFITVGLPQGITNVSPMRVSHPRAAGLEEISRPFWPFLEGFEEGLENWRLASPAAGTPPLAFSTNAVNGYQALQIALPAGRPSAAIRTTVVRGWHLELFEAKGLRLWLRTAAGEGTAHFALLANSGATNQAVFPASVAVPVGPRWQKAEVLFDKVPEAQRAEVDLLTIEFRTRDARTFLLDDLSLLGRWRLELE